MNDACTHDGNGAPVVMAIVASSRFSPPEHAANFQANSILAVAGMSNRGRFIA